MLFNKLPINLAVKGRLRSAGPLKVLFCCEAVTLAHKVRPWLLARSLLESESREYDVYFASSESFNFIFPNPQHTSGLKLTRLKLSSRTPQEFSAVLERGEILFDETRLNDYVSEEIALLSEVCPDLVIGDLRPSLAVSCAHCHVPYWNITNGYWSPHATRIKAPFPALAAIRNLPGPTILKHALLSMAQALYPIILKNIFKAQGAGINALRSKFGLSPYKDYLTGFSYGDRVLFADTPGIVPTDNLPANHTYLGALSWTPDAQLPSWFDSLPTNRPLVYVSLGSSGLLEALTLVVETLSSFPVSVVVSTAGRQLPPMKASENIKFVDFIPGEIVSRKASLVITNGGSPTSYQALREGRPVLGIATNMDQLLAISRVEASGAGIMLRSDTLTAKVLRKAIKKMLADSAVAARAQTIGRELSSYDYKVIFNELIEADFPQISSKSELATG